jgi:hypothetical protein
MTAGIVLLHGYTHGEFAADHRVHPPVATDRVPEAVLRGGPVIDPTGIPVRSHALPDPTVALTFDDGPDPTWTPRTGGGRARPSSPRASPGG